MFDSDCADDGDDSHWVAADIAAEKAASLNWSLYERGTVLEPKVGYVPAP